MEHSKDPAKRIRNLRTIGYFLIAAGLTLMVISVLNMSYQTGKQEKAAKEGHKATTVSFAPVALAVMIPSMFAVFFGSNCLRIAKKEATKTIPTA